MDRVESNHPSFNEGVDFGKAANAELKSLLDAGHAELYASRSAAEALLGAPVLPSPLGDVVKIKGDGSEKHRIIQDSRAPASTTRLPSLSGRCCPGSSIMR